MPSVARLENFIILAFFGSILGLYLYFGDQVWGGGMAPLPPPLGAATGCLVYKIGCKKVYVLPLFSPCLHWLHTDVFIR